MFEMRRAEIAGHDANGRFGSVVVKRLTGQNRKGHVLALMEQQQQLKCEEDMTKRPYVTRCVLITVVV